MGKTKPKIPGWLRCPRKLSHEEAGEEWRRVVPQLLDLIGDQLWPIDKSLLECYCLSFAHWRHVQRQRELSGSAEEAEAWAAVEADTLEIATNFLAAFGGSIWAADYLKNSEYKKG